MDLFNGDLTPAVVRAFVPVQRSPNALTAVATVVFGGQRVELLCVVGRQADLLPDEL